MRNRTPYLVSNYITQLFKRRIEISEALYGVLCKYLVLCALYGV